MLKEIKNLTLDEMRYICEKQKVCRGCPISIKLKEGYMCLKKEIAFRKEINKKLSKKIEIDEMTEAENE